MTTEHALYIGRLMRGPVVHQLPRLARNWNWTMGILLKEALRYHPSCRVWHLHIPRYRPLDDIHTFTDG